MRTLFLLQRFLTCCSLEMQEIQYDAPADNSESGICAGTCCREEVHMNAIYTWLVVTAALLIIEALTAGLTTIWFAGGAVAALICTFLGAPFWIQTGVFAAVSLLLLLVTRPLALKYMRRGSGANSLDRMIGRQVLVTEQINNLRGTGEVQVDGQFWMARTADNDSMIEKGETVVIREIRGVKLIVDVVPGNQNGAH